MFAKKRMSGTSVEGRGREKELVLVGSVEVDYVNQLMKHIKKKGAAWSPWSFRIRDEWRDPISKQLAKKGEFPVFFYLSKVLGGSKKVEYKAIVADIRMSDEPTKAPDPDLTDDYGKDLSYTWFKFVGVEKVGPADLSSFKDIETEYPLTPSQLRSSFGYAYVPEEPEEYGQEIVEGAPSAVPLTALERDIRKYLVAHLDSLEQGLKLYQGEEGSGEEYPIEGGRMRIDILGIDRDDNLVVVELKAGTADLSTFGQISAYIGWVKQRLAKGAEVRGIIVAGDFDERMRYAASVLPYLKLKQYELKFSFKDVS
jgi:hypothetical protein